jgi:hypothetical protein
MPARKPKPDEKPQSERFIETAREIGADETPDAFERAFIQVVSPKETLGPKKETPSPIAS